MYPEIIQALLPHNRLPALGPGAPDEAVRARLAQLRVEDLGAVRDRAAAQACLAGLWLAHDFLDESHAISQEVHTVEGSFWHAIMHRREPDAWNSKYWWRRVGPHPVLDQLRDQAPSLGYNYANPQDFVDFCERVRDSGSPEEETARQVQALEWRLLFDHCHRQALS